MADVVLSQINVFPLKSARGISPPAWQVGPRGLLLDRHWMVAGADGVFLSQREIPRMALIGTEIVDTTLVLRAPEMPELHIAPAISSDRVQVRVWKDDVLAAPAGPEADAWMTAFLGRRCTVVSFPDDAVRQVDLTYGSPGDQVGFADGFSFLLISEASLAALNARLAQPIGMHRFRTNLAITGCAPFAEDDWQRVRIGEIEFDVVKPCARCPVTTVDEVRAVHGKEPLATLATFRRRDSKVMFGQNLIHHGSGWLRVGDTVTVLR